MLINKSPYVIVCIATVCSSAIADPTTTSLPQITVIGDFLGNTSVEELKRYPGARTVIDLESESKAKGDSEITDVVKRIPGMISSQNTGTGGSGVALNIGVRGLTQRLSPQSTVLMDGIPVANAPYSQPQLSFSPVTLGNLGSIDVVRGGGAVRYGPQNVGGIINFRSKSIPDEFNAEVSGTLRYFGEGDNDTQPDNLDLFVGGRSQQIPGLGAALSISSIQGETHRENSERDITNVYGKVNYQFNDRHSLTFLGQIYDGTAELAGGLSQAQYDADPYQSVRPFDEADVERQMLAIQHVGNLGTATKIESQLYQYTNERQYQFSQQTSAPFDAASSTRFDVLPREYDVVGVETRIAQGFSWGELGAGIRYLEEDSKESRFRRSGAGYDPLDPFASSPTLNRDTTLETEALAYFIDATINVNKLRLVPGVRVEDITLDFDDKLNDQQREITYDEVLPSLSMNYALSQQRSVFASYNRSFGSVQQVQLSSASRFNPDLDPEKADIYEIGTRFIGDNSQFDATVFLIDFDSRLLLDEGVWSNRGATKHQGLELSGEYAWPDTPFKVYANYTYTDAKDEGITENNGNDIEFVSEHVGLVGIEYSKYSFSLFAEVYGQSEQFADAANTEEESADGSRGIIPGFGLTNLGGNWFFNDNLTVSLGVRNVFNKEYFSRSTDSLGRGKYVGEPRTIWLKASAYF